MSLSIALSITSRNALGFMPVFVLSIFIYLPVHHPVGYFEELAVGEFICVLNMFQQLQARQLEQKHPGKFILQIY